MRNLVLLVEGEGDVAAVPVLVKKLLTDRNAWQHLRLDPFPISIDGIEKVTGTPTCRKTWLDRVRLAGKRPNTGAILALLDGDKDKVEGCPFCPAEVARCLAERSTETGAGAIFSVACVFAVQEFESWLVTGAESLAGKALPDGRPGLAASLPAKPPDIERARNAKGWLTKAMPVPYKPTTHQEPLTRMVELDAIRAAGLRSFRHLEAAVEELIVAVRDNKPVISPRRPNATGSASPSAG